MKQVETFFRDGKVSTIAIITMRGLLAAQDDDSIKEWMNELDMTIPADVEILQAGNIAFHNRVHDVENNAFATEFFKKIVRQKKSIFLLSDNQTNLEKLRNDILSYEEGISIQGSFALDSTDYADDFVANEINSSFADVLISNLESPVRESFLKENHMKLNVAIWMMVRADANLSHEVTGIWAKIHEQIVKKVFSIRLNRYQKSEEDKKD